MVNEITASSNGPTRGSVIFFLALASVFGLIALWPFAPAFESLKKDEARIHMVRKENYVSTTTYLKTSTGQNLKCVHTKTGGCDPKKMKSFLDKNTYVSVWHDGEKVYQLAAQNQTILPYEHFNKGKGFSSAISAVSFLVALIQIAIRKRLV